MSDAFERGMVTFCVSVLWIHGASFGNIALISRRSRGSVSGIVHRAFNTPREDMTFEERQALLDAMKAKRKDEGRLPEKYFTALPNVAKAPAKKKFPLKLPAEAIVPKLTIVKAAPETPASPMTLTARRKEETKRKLSSLRKKRIDDKARAEREAGGATKRGVAGDAVGWLYATRILADPQERSVDVPRPADGSMSSQERRREAAYSFRACMDGSRVGGMSSVDFESEVRGSGAGLGIPWKRLLSLDSLGAIRRILNERDFQMLEAVVDRDEFVWESVKSVVAKRFLYEAIRRCLDAVACLWLLMSRTEFERRWGYQLPEVDSMDEDQVREIARTAREMLRQGLRSA